MLPPDLAERNLHRRIWNRASPYNVQEDKEESSTPSQRQGKLHDVVGLLHRIRQYAANSGNMFVIPQRQAKDQSSFFPMPGPRCRKCRCHHCQSYPVTVFAARAPCVAISHRRSLGNASDLIAIIPPSQNSRVRRCVPLDPFVACGQHKRVFYGFLPMDWYIDKQIIR